MKIGITSLGMSGIPLETALGLMVAYGAECTELNGRPGVHPDVTWKPQDYPRVKRWLYESGIIATSLGGYNDFAQLDEETLEEQIAQLVGYCQRAADLEIPVVRAFAGDVKEGLTLEQVRGQIVRGFEETLRRTEGLGVRIGIENHGRLANDGDFLKGILDEIGSPRLGITLDTGNFAWAGHPLAEVQRFFRLLLPHVINVHVKDGIWQGGEFKFVPAGRGKLEIDMLVAMLAARGYDGAIVSEYEGGGSYWDGTRESLDFLHRIRNKVL